MSYSPKTAADGKPIEDTYNLPTPALSPISEHGTPSNISSHLERLDGDGSHNHESRQVPQAPEPKSIVADKDKDRSRLRRRSSETKALKLSPSQVLELTTSPDSLPLRALDGLPALDEEDVLRSADSIVEQRILGPPFQPGTSSSSSPAINGISPIATTSATTGRPHTSSRSASTPVFQRRQSSSKSSKPKPQLPALKTDDPKDRRSSSNSVRPSPNRERQASPMPSALPIPPLSLPTYLHLELSSDRPSALYIHRSEWADFPYESSKVKFERLLNFFYLPPNLEQVLWFGAIACLDAWLYTFTILPLRFLKALVILTRWIILATTQEAQFLASFVYSGIGRIWQRQRGDFVAGSRRPSVATLTEGEESRQLSAEHQRSPAMKTDSQTIPPVSIAKKLRSGYRHRRAKSTPSALLPNHKADLLQGLLIVCSCTMLMSFDASRMYHSIRGQSAIKLYVIYNMLEVFDRLFSAIGQDILECLFSKETLERDDDGRSKLLRPLLMFMLALAYNVIHATALFYQVVTLNVAVNSYSNALLTLLMSNQFVEIKGTVFKKFEKENLFQLTCADVVERFQLWLMLIVIACRNIVEVGGLSISLSSALGGGSETPTGPFSANGTGIPLVSGFMIPKAFTILPKWTSEVLGPFLIVLGSEALVDWCKHAYIGKFNNIKPNIYGRFLDVLAKDYYSHAFADQNLTKRFGLPVIPLSCLFIRACMQTYHMFLATHMPVPIPSSGTSIEEPMASPLTTAALQHIDQVFRRALGRSSFGAGSNAVGGAYRLYDFDDFIALATMVMFFLAIYLVCLAFKLVLGIGLLNYARRRYKGMKEREGQSVDTKGRRVGGWGTVEVNEDKRRWIYEDDPEGVHQLREKEKKGRERAEKGDMRLDGVERYVMASKRIW